MPLKPHQIMPGPWVVANERDSNGDPIRVLYGHTQWEHAVGQPWVPERIAELWPTNPETERCILAARDALLFVELIANGCRPGPALREQAQKLLDYVKSDDDK